jgi:hypothetical protein
LNDKDLHQLAVKASKYDKLVYPLPLPSDGDAYFKKLAEIFPNNPFPVDVNPRQPSPFEEMKGDFGEIPVKYIIDEVAKVLLHPDGDARALDFAKLMKWDSSDKKQATLGEKVEEWILTIETAIMEMKETAICQLSEEIIRAADKLAEVIVKCAFTAEEEQGVVSTDQGYLQINFNDDRPVSKFMGQNWFRKSGETAHEMAIYHKIIIPARAILAMMGGRFNWTPLHVDTTQAETRAFLVKLPGRKSRVKHGEAPPVVATWFFFSPRVLHIVNKYLQDKYSVDLSCGKDKMPFITEGDFKRLEKLCGVDDNGNPLALRLEQRHGECFRFHTGWAHQVYNVEDGVLKPAFDRLKLEHLPLYAYVRALIHCPLMVSEGSVPPEDYAGVESLAVAELTAPMPTL